LASKELRLIGWRVGWVAGPRQILRDIGVSPGEVSARLFERGLVAAFG
jgi:aspartate/methionine/tyrosine aminotransferase